MANSRSVLAPLLLLFVSCNHARPAVQEKPSRGECAVMSVGAANVDAAFPLLPRSQFEEGLPLADLSRELRVPRDALSDLYARNKVAAQIGTACIASIRSETPRHYTFVSRPGFSRDMTHAVLLVGVDCGSRCGGVDLVAFTSSAGHWVEADRAGTAQYE